MSSILVVEDDGDVRERVVAVLRGGGPAVAEASNGLEALERLRSGSPRPQLILLDLMMPVMDGWDFRFEQKRDAALAQIPIVLVSADVGLKEKTGAMEAAGYLTKPLSEEALLAMVQRLCSP